MSDSLFQFHKVRLKVTYLFIVIVIQRVFQFHKVRLKEGDKIFWENEKAMFQFHKVRLKDKKNHLRKPRFQVSIP